MKIIKSRIFKILVTVFIFGFVLGIISYFIIGSSKDSIINYFSLIENGNFNYINSLINTLFYNYKLSIFIWISGIIFFFIILIPFLILYRGISLGLLFINLLISYKTKGLILFVIMLFPSILLNELIFILLSYYSINFSLKMIKSIKYNKSINIKSFCKNYFYIFLISLISLLISSLFEIYITSNIIKYVL